MIFSFEQDSGESVAAQVGCVSLPPGERLSWDNPKVGPRHCATVSRPAFYGKPSGVALLTMGSKLSDYEPFDEFPRFHVMKVPPLRDRRIQAHHMALDAVGVQLAIGHRLEVGAVAQRQTKLLG